VEAVTAIPKTYPLAVATWVGWQAPFEQVAPWQLCPHAPQSAPLVARFWHPSAPHAASEAGHSQAPFWHVVPPVHGTQLEPQLLLSFEVSQHPALQAVYPPTHSYVHVPPPQIGFAFATDVVQALPQALQFSGSRVVSTHVLAHSVGSLAGQPVPHAGFPLESLVQSGSAPEQVTPHPPQFPC
jgi:hypothetical protein